EESRWQALAVFEASKDGAIKQLKETEKEIAGAAETLEAIKHDATVPQKTCARFADPPAEAGDAVQPPAPEEPLTALHDQLKLADEQLGALVKLGLPKFLGPANYVWAVILLALVGAYPLVTQLGVQNGLIADAVIAIAVGVGVWFWLAKIARAKVAPVFH